MSYARINNSPYAASSGYSSPTSLEHRSPPGSGQNSEVNSGHYRKRSVGISESSHAASYAKASGMVNMSLNSDGWAKLAEPDDYLVSLRSIQDALKSTCEGRPDAWCFFCSTIRETQTGIPTA